MHSGLVRSGFPHNPAPEMPSEQRFSHSKPRQRPDTNRDDFATDPPRHYSSQEPVVERATTVTGSTNESERLENPIHNTTSQNQNHAPWEADIPNNDREGATS